MMQEASFSLELAGVADFSLSRLASLKNNKQNLRPEAIIYHFLAPREHGKTQYRRDHRLGM
jgi:hypothetical protein